jgi:macrolide transport system ATP-binding/permease protein
MDLAKLAAVPAILRDLAQDLRYGFRSLRGKPGFTITVVSTLALGIGANAAIFSLINAVFLRPLPVRDPAGLVLLSDPVADDEPEIGKPGVERGRLRVYAHPLYQRLQQQREIFAQLAAQAGEGSEVIVRRSGPEGGRLQAGGLAAGLPVSGNFFQVLGVRAALGRTLRVEDEAPAADPVVVIGHHFWQRRFEGDPSVIGERLRIADGLYTIVGVAAPEFASTKTGHFTDFWVPLARKGDLERVGREVFLNDPQRWWLQVFGRLAPGVPLATAQAAANATLAQYLAESPAAGRAPAGIQIGLEPGARGYSREARSLREPLQILSVGVGLLLLIVCLNLSHLLLARALDRGREMTIRSALGATGGRLLRQLLAEGVLLAALGGVAALVATSWLNDGLLALVADGRELPLDLAPDLRVLGFITALALATAVLLGLVPAWRSGSSLQQRLWATAPSIAGGGSRRWLSRLLLVSQIALSLVLLVAAGLMAGSVSRLRAVDKGLDEKHLLLVALAPEKVGIGPEQGPALSANLIARATALPGVRAVSLALFGPLRGASMRKRLLVGGKPGPSVEVDIVTAGYFEAVGMRLLRGRSVTAEDHGGATPVAFVNEVFARQILGASDPSGALNQRVVFDPEQGEARVRGSFTVAGVVGALRPYPLNRDARPTVYLSAAQLPGFLLDRLQVRTVDGFDPGQLADGLRAAVHETHPGLPITTLRTVGNRVEQALRPPRLLATLSSVFGLAALLLVSIGLHGLISQWAGQRRQEMGVRLALGATRGGLRWLVLRQALALAGAGLALGLPAAAAVAGLLEELLFRTTATDAPTLGSAALLLIAVAAVAAYLPARRASRADPMVALRSE